jgi:uncharacterized membrane protein
LKQIEALEVPEMEQVIQAYQHVTVTPEFKEAERLRSKARHDEAQALKNEREKTTEMVKDKMRRGGISDEEINRIMNL